MQANQTYKKHLIQLVRGWNKSFTTDPRVALYKEVVVFALVLFL